MHDAPLGVKFEVTSWFPPICPISWEPNYLIAHICRLAEGKRTDFRFLGHIGFNQFVKHPPVSARHSQSENIKFEKLNSLDRFDWWWQI